MNPPEELAVGTPVSPHTATRRFGGVTLIGVTAAALALLAAHALSSSPSAEEAARLLIRQTARLSLVTFCAAFAASSAVRLWPGAATRWMMRNRRWLGLSFALSHLFHLIAILALLEIAPDFEVETTSIVFGGAAYVFIAALAATSFDGAVARLGKRRWQLLHKTGVYYIWVIFALSYTPRALTTVAYVPAALLLYAALALRIAARRRA